LLYSIGRGDPIHIYVDGRVSELAGTAIGLLAMYGIWAFASGKKKAVLYLRRFRSTSSNQVLEQAMSASLHRTARLVVLDDGVFPPISLPLGDRMLGIAAWIPLTVLVLTCLLIGQTVVGDRRVDGVILFQLGVVATGSRGFITVMQIPPTAVDASVYATGSLFTEWPIALATWSLTLLLAIPVWRYLFLWRESRNPIRRSHDVNRLVRRIRFIRSRFAAPKPAGALVTVVSCADELWKEAVRRLAREADAIVIDVSHPSEAVMWELAHCAAEHGDKLLVTANEKEHSLLSTEEATRGAIEHFIRKSRMHAVLQWDTSMPQSAKRFHRSLRAFIAT
jgi:hypothetical protein